MLSNMTVTKLLLPIVFLFSTLLSNFGYGESLVDVVTIIPSISIGTCSPLINGKSFAICCKVSFLDGAQVTLYGPKGIFQPYKLPVYYVSNNSLSLMCSNWTIGNITFACRRTEFESLYWVNFPSFDQTRHLGDWSCGAKIGLANMTLSSRQVITRNDGLVETQVNQTVQLLWNVTQNYVVMSPSNEVLVNISGDVLYSKSDHVEFVRNNATGKTGIKLNNTSGSDAGMYVLQASSGVRAALFLQVQEKPTQPKAIYKNLDIVRYLKVASAILYCWSESQSKGPMMYEQRVEYRWNGLTNQTGLHAQLYGSGVTVWNVDCTKVTSYPISCNAEQYGLESETTWIIPQSLCLMSKSGGNIYYDDTTSFPVFWIFFLSVGIPIISLGFGVFSIVNLVNDTGCCIKRSYAHHRCVCGRYICESSCHQRFCQATRNRFTAVFQAMRRCFYSTVIFIQYCNLRRRERNQNVENSILSTAGAYSQSAEGMEAGVMSGAVNQPSDGVRVDVIDGAVNQTVDDINIQEAIIGGDAGSSSTDAERNDQYQIEAISDNNLDGIDVEIGDQGTEGQSADGMEPNVISGVVDQPEDGDGEDFIDDAVNETLDALEILHSLLEHPPQMLRVRRSQIVTDVLGLFEDSSTGTQLISTRFIDEDGVDGGGVTREMLTVFWNEVKERYFHGNEVFVPHLRPERLSQKQDFVTLGRIFSLSTAILQSIPIQICRSTLMVIIYDTCDVNPDTLLDDFLLFLDNEDRELLKSSLNCLSFDDMREEEKDKLQEFLMKFGMGIVLKPATLKQYMINLAQNELCIKPKFFCENMRKGIPQRHLEDFWMQITLDHLDHLYRDFLVTAENIWLKIRFETWPLQNPNEIRVYGYLRDLIQDLEEETLLSFVQFVTADRKIPSSFITVGFNDTWGIARCPIASTCAYRLDIPVSYNSYEEFKTEFMMVLKSDEAKTFSKD